ncbi:uncharacterized protein KGF55_002704 [Candida pseudojiufengensis]|uniref:uncharacterized protein n=1 Tax=Candida pseudojiufengensis TaxID=497109 RepID=UPI0022255583|nr:uncharacterized protein KGF55_002704 [Candida pseudojiufengensis]KAI5963824.1 hypothetical protein KGF55_002704 [Candida pseudojiufengensis]
MKSFTSSSSNISSYSSTNSPSHLQSSPSPSRKNWKAILRPNKHKSGNIINTNINTNNISDYDYSLASSKLFPTLSIQESSNNNKSPISNISTPTFDNNINYKTPNTSPIKLNSSPRNQFLPNKDPFDFGELNQSSQIQMDGLNISFANILNNNSPQIKQETKLESPESLKSNRSNFSQTTSPSPVVIENNCFICSELLSNVFQSERVLKLNCGDSVHYECFKIMFSKELEEVDSKNKIIKLSSLCNGNICKGEYTIEIDNKKLNLMSRRSSSLTPKRPAPAQPKRNSEIKQSINFEALKSTLNDVQRKPSSKRDSMIKLKSSRQNSIKRELSKSKRDTSDFSLRSVSPVTTISTIMTETYNPNDFDDGEIENIINQLIKFLLDNCPNFNLSKLSTLGKLRVADQLQIKINNNFLINYCYLFENFMIIWNETQPIYFSMKETKIISKGSIITIQNPENSISIKSEINYIIEKWAIALMDLNLELPGSKITNTILLKPKLPISERNSMGESIFIDRPKSLNFKLLDTVESNNNNSDNNSDANSDINSDVDSDIDSDDEIIKNVLKDKKQKPIIDLQDLQNLILEIDEAMF